MKMKATESGSIREQGNGAEADNTAREKKRTNIRVYGETEVCKTISGESAKKRKKVKRQYIYDTQ